MRRFTVVPRNDNNLITTQIVETNDGTYVLYDDARAYAREMCEKQKIDCVLWVFTNITTNHRDEKQAIIRDSILNAPLPEELR